MAPQSNPSPVESAAGSKLNSNAGRVVEFDTVVTKCLQALADTFPDDERLKSLLSKDAGNAATRASVFRGSLGSRPDLIRSRDPALFGLFRDVGGFDTKHYFELADDVNKDVAWDWLSSLDAECPEAPPAADAKPEYWSPAWAARAEGQEGSGAGGAAPPLSQLTDVLQQATTGPEGAEFGKMVGSMMQMVMSSMSQGASGQPFAPPAPTRPPAPVAHSSAGGRRRR